MGEAEDHRVGDVVRDRQTGQVMVVIEVLSPIFRFRYVCRWTTAERRTTSTFKFDEIERVPPASSPSTN